MKILILLVIPFLALAAPKKDKKPKVKGPAKRVATKVESGKQICQMIEKIAAKGFPQQVNIDFPVSKSATAQGKVGAINQEVGTFTLANLYLRGMATGNEGQVYKDRCLKIEFPDLDKDGVKDLEISATIQSIDPKSGTALGSTEYHREFIYHPDVKIYVPMNGSAHPFVELVVR